MTSDRVRRSSPGRDQMSPQTERVMYSWNGRRKVGRRLDGPFDVRLAQHLAADLHADLMAGIAHGLLLGVPVSSRWSRMSRVTASGCSALIRCAAPTIATRAAGMLAAMARLAAGGAAGSLLLR